MTQPVKIWPEAEGRLLRLRLNRPKANLVDAAMIAALDAALARNSGNGRLSAVILDAEGPHFSFGASVEEHMPATMRCHVGGAAQSGAAHDRIPGAVAWLWCVANVSEVG